jgi:hypothetical protein
MPKTDLRTPSHGGDLEAGLIACGRLRIVEPEQLVRAVDRMNVQSAAPRHNSIELPTSISMTTVERGAIEPGRHGPQAVSFGPHVQALSANANMPANLAVCESIVDRQEAVSFSFDTALPGGLRPATGLTRQHRFGPARL